MNGTQKNTNAVSIKDHKIFDGASVVSINEHKLDAECVRLPSDYLKYATLVADLRAEVDELKAALEVTEADISRLVRENPTKYGLEKITDKGLESVVSIHTKVLEAARVLAKAKHDLDLASAVVGALEHKKRSLSLLVELHGMGYFAAPKISPQGKEALLAENAKRQRMKYTGED